MGPIQQISYSICISYISFKPFSVLTTGTHASQNNDPAFDAVPPSEYMTHFMIYLSLFLFVEITEQKFKSKLFEEINAEKKNAASRKNKINNPSEFIHSNVLESIEL